MRYSLKFAREYWRFVPTSIGTGKILTEKLCLESHEYIKQFVERDIEERISKQGAKVYLEKVSSWIKKENVQNILDFGCGIGQDGVFFSKSLDVKVTFADIVEPNIKVVSFYSKIWNISTSAIHIGCDPKDFVFPEVYDMIYANGVLHHTPEARQIVENLMRFLKQNGLFVCMLYTPKHFKSRHVKTLQEYAKRSEAPASIENPYSDFYDEAKARELFRGFTLLDKFTTHHGKFGWYVFRWVGGAT